MGMFDLIKLKTKCPECGSEISGFQSKDGDCMLDCLEFWQVNNFYSSCDHCNTMVNYSLNKDKRDKTRVEMEKIRVEMEKIRRSLTIDDYDVEFGDAATLAKRVKERLEDRKKKKGGVVENNL